jgi:hypothetical protein
MSDLDEMMLKERAALVHVRTLCQIYGSCAQVVGRESDDQGISKYEKDQYERGRMEVLQITVKLTDELFRDSALRASLDFCMKARDLQFATMIAKAITTTTIQEKIVKDYSDYFVLNEKEGRLIPTAAAAIDPSLE